MTRTRSLAIGATLVIAVSSAGLVIAKPMSYRLPDETATFSIGFHPTSLGVFSQTFMLTSPQLGNQTLQVALVGDSISTTPPQTDAGVGSSAPGETSFYACSAGGAAGWPLVLVIPIIGRRRRGSS